MEAAGIRFGYRRFGRKESVPLVFLTHFTGTMDHWDPLVSDKVVPAQIAALAEWGTPRKDAYSYLKSIKQPTLIVNDNNDIIIYTVTRFIPRRQELSWLVR